MTARKNGIPAGDIGESELGQLFHQIALLVARKSSPDEDGDDGVVTTSDEEKLRLYGLYKRATDENDNGDEQISPSSVPSIFQPIARSKFLAWKECASMTRRDAMDEYVRIVASRHDRIGEECRCLRDQFYRKSNITQDRNNGSSSGIRIQRSPEENDDDDDDDDEQKNEVQAIDSSAQPKFQSEFSTQVISSNSSTDFRHSAKATSQTSSRSNAIAKWMGVRPLVPRGRLDISYKDLAFAFYQCIIQQQQSKQEYARFTRKINELWENKAVSSTANGESSEKATKAPSKVVVGLSVRSIFDLYLTMKGYPDGSEILVVPPISVPGMMHVARYHNLRIVPVDIDQRQGGKDGDDTLDTSSTNRWINFEELQSKVTNKTVAIMLVHPFGIVTTDDEMLRKLRSIADKHQLELWEDCAETFTGLGSENYLGSKTHADIRFFSFGTIKTATALGGGIALLKNGDVANHMNRLQQSLYTSQQTQMEYFRKVLTALVLNFIADSPLRVGLLSWLCVLCGFSFDVLVTRSVRGFHLPNSTGTAFKDNNRANNRWIQTYLVRQIRKRPSNALLAVLHRRFEQSRWMAPSVPGRIRRCKLMSSLLEKEIPNVAFPNLYNFVHTYWAFPICCHDRETISRNIQAAGFDVATGASQLCSVSQFTDDTKGQSLCPSTDQLMNSILYLPICSQNISELKLVELIRHLEDALKPQTPDSSCSKLDTTTTATPRKNPKPLIHATILIVLIMITGTWTGHLSSTRMLPFSVLIMFGCIIRICGEKLLHWTTAEFYLKESSAFAENCDMIDAICDDGESICNNEPSMNTSQFSKQDGVLNSMECLRIMASTNNNGVTGKRTVILTGATGFVGSALLRDLLVHRVALSLEKIIILCRKKGELSAESRLKSLLSKPIFEFLPQEEKLSLIEVVEGDVTMHSAGLSPMDLARIVQDLNISHVFHCAAAVSFTLEFPNAAQSNITSSLNMQALTGRLKNKEAQFVHISTAFVHGDKIGSKESPLPEELFDFESFDPSEIYRSMIGTQFYASKAMAELNFPNTYSFSKSVCEHLLSQNNHVDTLIIRPSIVGPAIETPFEGWAGDRPSTIVAGPCLHLSHQWNIWHLGRQRATCFPVDLLARFIISKAFHDDSSQRTNCSNDGASSSDGSFERISNNSDEYSESEEIGSTASSQNMVYCRFPRIFNATWDTRSSQNALFSWLEFSVAYLHLGSVLGYFSRSSAMMQLFISAQLIPRIKPSNATYELLQSLLIRPPFELAAASYEYMRFNNPKLTKLLAFLDLPLLFYPFVKTEFYFQSELTAPHSFDVKRYSFSCGVAAHRFISSRMGSKEKTLGRLDSLKKMSSFAVGGKNHSHGSSYLWWAICQPRGDILLRLVAAFVGYLLGAISTVVTVDLNSFRNHLSAVRSKGTSRPVHLVLVPTHRSFFDFILLSYVFFSLPELQINLPFIIAADEFQHLPVIGWLARQLQAFYIQRGKGRADANLSTKLESLKEQHGAVTFEVFIEGRRSRDRRFVEPKTGLLKSLKTSGGEHVILPITINYECVPEQHILSEEAASSNRRMLNLTGMVLWLKEVLRGKVDIGKIHIAASDPLSLDCRSDTDFKLLVDEIQKKQQKDIVLSDYHLKAASCLIDVEYSILKTALPKLGCRFWPETCIVNLPELPGDPTNLLTVVLHFGHILAPLFFKNRRKWSIWLNRLCSSSFEESILLDNDVNLLYNRLGKMFDSADTAVNDALSRLKSKGFEDPDCDHVFQTAEAMKPFDIPGPVMRAAVLMRIGVPGKREKRNNLLSPVPVGNMMLANLSDSDENIGFWGFKDSGFIAKTDNRGRRYVTMKGTRYALCGKRMTKILPFIESALNVKINTANEFTCMHPRWHSTVETDLPLADQKYLESLLQGQLSFSTLDRLRHGTGHSQEDVFAIRNGEDIRIPDAVLWPSSEAQVIAIVDAARRKGWCLIPYGGGTNVIEATRCPSKQVEPRPILTVSTKRLNRILWLNEEDGLAHIEAGITGRELVEILDRRGYTMGHEPDSIEFSTLGGWIATKASGMKRSKYGNIENIVVSSRIVGPNGVLWKGAGDQTKIVAGRHSEGMDVHDLAFGSEGCLGIVTSAVIRVWPLPEVRTYDSVVFPTFRDGLSFLRALSREPRSMPSCVRLLDNAHFRLGQALRPDESSWMHRAKDAVGKALASAWLARDWDPESVVCATLSYEGSDREVRDQMAAVARLARTHGGLRLGAGVGKAGYELTFMIAYLRDFAMTYHVLGESFETFVPWSRIEPLIAATKDRICAEHDALLLPGRPFVGCRVTQLYHEGACLYFYLCIGFEGIGDGRASTVYADLERAARDEILRQGGSLSHHHGLGKLRSSFAKERSSPGFQSVIASLKESMDRDNVFGARNGLFAP